MKTTEPEKRRLIARGSDDAFKDAVFRTLNWEPQQFKRYAFRRACGWRDGGVSTVGLYPDDYTAKRHKVRQHIKVSIWFEARGWQSRTLTEYMPIENWYALISRGRIKPLFK